MTKTQSKVSPFVIQRLARYYFFIQILKKKGIEWVSSRKIASVLGLTSSTVRQDISHIDFSGISKRGYEVGKLKNILAEVLGADRKISAIIVGAGNFGRALLLHEQFRQQGFHIKAIFDSAATLVGKKIGEHVIRAMDKLVRYVKEQRIEVGIIAVPGEAAQQVADKLVKTVVKGILNLSTVDLHVPPKMVLINSRIILDLLELSYSIKRNRKN